MLAHPFSRCSNIVTPRRHDVLYGCLRVLFASAPGPDSRGEERDMKYEVNVANARRGKGGSVIGCSALVVLVLTTLSAIARANAADTETISDIKCVVVGTRLSESSDQRQKTSGQMLLIYYLGRIQGRTPKADLEALIRSEAKKMTPSAFSEAARRCGTELSVQGAAISKIGQSLSQLGN